MFAVETGRVELRLQHVLTSFPLLGRGILEIRRACLYSLFVTDTVGVIRPILLSKT